MARASAEYAVAIAREMGLPAPALGRVRIASRLHDLGKVWISRDILDKPGPLTEARVGRDPATSADGGAAAPATALHDLADIIVAHHERPDGTGYPDGIPSAEVPLEAQIVAAADVYDAMLSPRPYAPALTPEEARRRARARGGHAARRERRRGVPTRAGRPEPVPARRGWLALSRTGNARPSRVSHRACQGPGTWSSSVRRPEGSKR